MKECTYAMMGSYKRKSKDGLGIYRLLVPSHHEQGGQSSFGKSVVIDFCYQQERAGASNHYHLISRSLICKPIADDEQCLYNA